jgi:uncharacterized protein YbjT (DUF2867 family)
MDGFRNTILVIGATGRQGGAVARHLIKDGNWHVRTITRDPSKLAAKELSKAGVEVMQGNIDDIDSLHRAMRDAYGVFAVTNYWEHGYDKEVQHGKNLVDAAQYSGVEHFVFSSVGGSERESGIPHFDSKWEIERYVYRRRLNTTIFRPVFFMENFNAWYRPTMVDGILTLSLALKSEKALQMIAVDDIGAFVAMAFKRPHDFYGKEIEIAGDELTGPKVAEIFGKVLGQTVRYQQMPIEQLRASSAENAAMFEWFENSGYRADIQALREMYPDLMTLEKWASENLSGVPRIEPEKERVAV